MDFTIQKYKLLLNALISRNYSFLTFNEFQQLSNKSEPKLCVLLRHDVDKLPQNSLRTAQIENSLGIKGSYYFRIIPISYDTNIIKKIADLGHEVGYHYEDVDLILKSKRNEIIKSDSIVDEEKLVNFAYESFCNNLNEIRKITKVNTICMHGSPLSKYDNKAIWGKYNYRELEIIGEPYFDICWDEFGYLTDTGRRWNAGNASIRDKVNSRFEFNFKRTDDIINNVGSLPDKMMITVHPQRWNDNVYSGLKELLSQNAKNVIKKYFLSR